MKLTRTLTLIAWLGAGLVAPLGAVAETPPPDPLAGAAGNEVCVAVPVFYDASKQGGCPVGEQSISNDPAQGGAIVFYLKEILRLVNGLIGGIIVLVLVIGGVQYITSAGDPTRIKDAKKRINNAIIALVLYMLMVAILNFLIPGGILV